MTANYHCSGEMEPFLPAHVFFLGLRSSYPLAEKLESFPPPSETVRKKVRTVRVRTEQVCTSPCPCGHKGAVLKRCLLSQGQAALRLSIPATKRNVH